MYDCLQIDANGIGDIDHACLAVAVLVHVSMYDCLQIDANGIGDIALDDLLITEGVECDFSNSDGKLCDFDGHLCLYENNHSSDELDFYPASLNNENSPDYLPAGRETFAYTRFVALNHFVLASVMLISRQYNPGSPEGEVAILWSPMLSHQPSFCLEFFVHMEFGGQFSPRTQLVVLSAWNSTSQDERMEVELLDLQIGSM